MDIITRVEARAAGLKRYYTGEPCVNGHVEERDVALGKCYECRRESNRKWREANPERNRENNRKSCLKYREANPERSRESDRKYREANPDKFSASSSLRRARKLNATTPDTCLEAIRAIYADVAGIADLLGEPCEVDHIIALANGGLHHQDNLQIITTRHNRQKAAKKDFTFGPPVYEQIIIHHTNETKELI